MSSKLFLLAIIALTEGVYIATSIATIRQVRIEKDNASGYDLVDRFILLFLCVGITTSLNNFIPEVTRLPFVLFIICEQLLLFAIFRKIVERGKHDVLLYSLFLIPIISLPILISIGRHQILYDLTYACSSLIASTLSFIYFRQLAKKSLVLDVFKDKNTLIMLGLFLTYSIPLTCTVAILAIELLEPNFTPEIRKTEASEIIFILITRITTVCYTALNFFIIKAYKCRQQPLLGIS